VFLCFLCWVVQRICSFSSVLGILLGNIESLMVKGGGGKFRGNSDLWEEVVELLEMSVENMMKL
jgi:hypothetical protein